MVTEGLLFGMLQCIFVLIALSADCCCSSVDSRRGPSFNLVLTEAITLSILVTTHDMSLMKVIWWGHDGHDMTLSPRIYIEDRRIINPFTALFTTLTIEGG